MRPGSRGRLDPERSVFVDETWASTNMTRTPGRCRRGERLRVGVAHSHWKTTTFVACRTTRGTIVPFLLDGPINRIAFETYVERVPPELRKGDIVVMDNLFSHERMRTRQDRGGGCEPPLSAALLAIHAEDGNAASGASPSVPTPTRMVHFESKGTDWRSVD